MLEPALGRSQQYADEGERHPWRRPEAIQPVRIICRDQQSIDAVAVLDRAKRAASAPAGPFPTSTGGTGQVCSISSSSHERTAVDIARTVGQLRSSETGQVRCDDTVGPDQLRDHSHPHRRATPPAAARSVGRLRPPARRWTPRPLATALGDGQAGQQSLTRVVAGGTSSTFLNFVLPGHAALLSCVSDRLRGSGGVGARPEARAAGHKRDGAHRERTHARLDERRSGPSRPAGDGSAFRPNRRLCTAVAGAVERPVAHDPATAVELDLTAGGEQLLELGAAALHPGLHPRGREAELGGRARLREPFHFGEREGIPLERGSCSSSGPRQAASSLRSSSGACSGTSCCWRSRSIPDGRSRQPDALR